MDEEIIPCDDFSDFQEALASLRKDDDNIILILNKLTQETECASIWERLTSGYEHRERAIDQCIRKNENNFQHLSEQYKKNKDNVDLEIELMNAKSCLSNMKSELEVEKIVKNRSLSLFKQKCPSIKEAKRYQGIMRVVPEHLVGPSRHS